MKKTINIPLGVRTYINIACLKLPSKKYYEIANNKIYKIRNLRI